MLATVRTKNAVRKQVIHMVLVADAALFCQLLNIFKEFGSDDSLVAIRNIILWNLPLIFDFSKGQHSGSKLLLHQTVSNEFFIGQNVTYGGAKPFSFAVARRDP